MRTVIEVVYDNLSDYVATDVIDWGINDDTLYFREATSPNRTTFVPICAIRYYSIEKVPDRTEKEKAVMGGRGLPEIQLTAQM